MESFWLVLKRIGKKKKMKTILKVETKYNENLADAQVLVVTLLSNNNRTWDFIVEKDAYHTLRLNEDYLVTTQDDWLGTIVGIRFETVANAINLKATVLKPVPMKYKNDGILNEVNMTESVTTLKYMIHVFSRIIHENGGTLSYEDNILTDIIDYSGDPVYIFTGKDKYNNLLVVVSKSSNVDFIGDTQVFI